jgi:hypothetical protein
MRVECAVLCDAASLRENLLHVLGAGVTSVALREFPASLPITFAFRAVLESREIRPSHTLRVELTDSTTEHVEAALETNFTFSSEETEIPPEAAAVAPLPLNAIKVSRPGLYLLQASLDQHHIATLPLRVDLRTD